MLKLVADNPSPFKQPFLELVLVGSGVKVLKLNDRIDVEFAIWHIDVDGAIDKYIAKDNSPTEFLVELCKSLAKAGLVMKQYSRYIGSGGPNVLMRHGALFYRMGAVENPTEDVFAYEYRPPEYRGPK